MPVMEASASIENLPETDMHLARFPRVRLFPAPTPLERLDNLTRALGGPEIWIKRDDCTVVATGGNKVRKLEWLIGEARSVGATHIVTQGAVHRTTSVRPPRWRASSA